MNETETEEWVDADGFTRYKCETDADRAGGTLRCPGAVPIACQESPTGWYCWWCGDSCSPPT